MKRSVNQSQFIDAFRNVGRADQFSYEALVALYEYYTALEEDWECEVELDPIAICCEWSEYETAWEACGDMLGNPIEWVGVQETEDEEEIEAAAMEYLRDNTQVVEFKGGVLVADF